MDHVTNDILLDLPTELVVLLNRDAINSLMWVCKRFRDSIIMMSITSEFWMKLGRKVLRVDTTELATLSGHLDDNSKPTHQFINILRHIIKMGTRNAIRDDVPTLRVLWVISPRTKRAVFRYLKKDRRIRTFKEVINQPCEMMFDDLPDGTEDAQAATFWSLTEMMMMPPKRRGNAK